MGNFNGAALQEFRETKGWTQAQLAELLGVNVAQISRWEAAKAKPWPRHIKKIRQVLGPRKARVIFAAVEK